MVTLCKLFNIIMTTECIPSAWRNSILVPIFQEKGDVQECKNYRGIKLLTHTFKIWEKVVDRRLRECTEIHERQFGFMPGRSTTDAIFQGSALSPYLFLILMDAAKQRCAVQQAKQLQCGCGVAPRICLEPIPIPHTHGCTDRSGEKRSNRIHDVCGRHCTLWR